MGASAASTIGMRVEVRMKHTAVGNFGGVRKTCQVVSKSCWIVVAQVVVLSMAALHWDQ